jgi:CHAT domain-containing protein/Tfp pilus assembly protein PilF
MNLRRHAIFLLILTSCGTSPDAHYRNGRLFLKRDKLNEAMREAEAGMRAESSWRFRLLEADVLLTRSDGNAAQKLLAFPHPPSDLESLARLRMDQGALDLMAFNYSGAEALLEQASQTAKQANLPLLEALIENRTGLLQLQQGQLAEGELHFHHVIDVTGGGRDPYVEASATNNLGYRFLKSFQLEEAIYWFEKARLMFRQLEMTNSYYLALANLGSCYQRLGDFDQALANYREAEDHARQINDSYHQQQWIGNSGEVLSDRGEFQGAAQKFQQALAIAKSRDKNETDSTAWWYYNLASISIESGDYEKADLYNKEALKRTLAIANHSDFYPRVNEATIAAGRKDANAEELYRALIAESHKDPVQMLEARAGLAKLLAEQGKLDQADAQFRTAITYLESERIALIKPDNRMSYLAKLIRFYDRYIDFLVDQKKTERALEVAESSRARVLAERLESEPSAAVVGAAQMRELARSSHSVFLSYWLGRRRSFLWAVTGDGIALHVLPAESQITPLVNGYRSFLEDLRDPMDSEYAAGRKLSELLLSPVHELLGPGNRVVVVPDRSLHSLNFETLPDPENSTKYVIERTTLEVAPSLDTLAERRPAPAPGDAVLLIGNPDQVIEEYPRLPFAGSEIGLISKAMAPRRISVLEGAKAYPSAYRNAKPSEFAWIHFAAHAAANRTEPLDSALILSRGAFPEDAAYQLSARDVMAVPLRASLVTLSACRSAGARTYSGEGQVGLCWAFLRAGSRSVVAGLWDVTDRSTAALMADFYDQLAHNAPPVEALRHAKLTLLRGGKAYQKPFYWGPFQLFTGAI